MGSPTPSTTDEPPDADPAALKRRRSVVVAGHAGDRATALGAWQDADARVRALALGSLRRSGELPKEVLAEAFGDPAPIVRRRACEEAAALGASGPPGLLHRVEDRLVDGDVTVVEAACFALGELLGSGAPGRPDEVAGPVEALARVATSHADVLCREAAVAALGAIGDPRGLPAILAATKDKAAVRRRAILALSPFEGDAVDEALTRALSDRDWQVRQAAEDVGGAT